MVERYSGFLCVLFAVGTKTIGAVADRANNLASESHPRSVKWLVVVVGRKGSSPPTQELRPPPSKATASQQSMSCMKHLIEAEREYSVPSSEPNNFGWLLNSTVQLDASFETAPDTNSVSPKAHRIVQITLVGDRIRAFTHVEKLAVGAER